MFLVLLPGELPTREVEGLEAVLRPLSGAADSLDQQFQGLGVEQEFLQASFLRLPDEPLGVLAQAAGFDDATGVIERQRIEPKHGQFAVWSDFLELVPVVRT